MLFFNAFYYIYFLYPKKRKEPFFTVDWGDVEIGASDPIHSIPSNPHLISTYQKTHPTIVFNPKK